jgi:purine-binding chemotaxis protein CheW
MADREPATALVVFQVGDQFYGAPVEMVAEIMPLVAVSPIPQMPHDWLGVANIRGRVTPVVDMHVRLGMPAEPPRLSSPLIILREDRRQVAILVDRIEQVLYQAAESEQTEAPALTHQGRLLVMLDSRLLFG